MKKTFHLANCSTCQRIISELDLEAKGFDLQDIKTENITEEQIELMAQLSGSYESLFSRRAMKYNSMGLKDKSLSEDDYKKLILEEYTFLKRPVSIVGDKIFVGNSKKIVESLAQEIA